MVKASYFVLAYKLLCGDNKLKGGSAELRLFRGGRDFNSLVVPVRAKLHRVPAPYEY